MTLQERLRQTRGKQSREKFARPLGISAKTVERWEKGETVPGDRDLLLMAERTGVRYEWLSTGEGPMQDESSVINETAATSADAGGERSVTTTRYLLFVADGKVLVRIPLGTPEIVGDIEIAGGFTIEEDR